MLHRSRLQYELVIIAVIDCIIGLLLANLRHPPLAPRQCQKSFGQGSFLGRGTAITN